MTELKKEILAAVDELMRIVKEETGVSEKFIEAARPSIEAIFTDVEAQRRPECIQALWETAALQAETEQAIARARMWAKRLENAQNHLLVELGRMNRRVEDARNSVASTTLGIMGGLSDAPRTPYES